MRTVSSIYNIKLTSFPLNRFLTKNLIIVIYFLCTPLINTVHGQIKTEWEFETNGSKDDEPVDVIRAHDGNVIVFGSPKSVDEGFQTERKRSDMWVMKVDARTGELLWKRNYGGNLNDYAGKVIKTSDGGYLLAGHTSSVGGDISKRIDRSYKFDLWIIKIDSKGNKIWDRCYGGNSNDSFKSVVETQDEGFIITAQTLSRDGEGDIEKRPNKYSGDDIWLFKIDKDGNIVWQKIFLEGKSVDITESTDNNYYITGYADHIKKDTLRYKSNYDFWVIKVDINGNVKWKKNFSGGYKEKAVSITPSSRKNGVVILGNLYIYDEEDEYYQKIKKKGGRYEPPELNNRIKAIEIDENGNQLWEYVSDKSDSTSLDAQSIIKNEKGDYILLSNGLKSDSSFVLATTLSSSGKEKESVTVASNSSSKGLSIIEVDKGAYVIAGCKESSTSKNYWVFKLPSIKE